MSRPILAVIAALLSLPFAVNAQSLTHLGQPQAEHVTLDYEFDPNNLCANSAIFVRRFANGTEAPNRFRVPNGKILIITDLVWEAAPDQGSGGDFLAGRRSGYRYRQGTAVVWRIDLFSGRHRST